MEELTISEVARRTGLRPSAIRYYESVNLLPAPRRVSGQRRYDVAILDRLSFIQVAQKLGFSLAEIQFLFHHQEENISLAEGWQVLARQKLAEVDTLIQRAHSMKQLLVRGMDCTCSNLHDCIDCVLMNCTEASSK
ncbi:MAG: MerR family transcriptional regulator [Ktedonobacteraceae bacterium]|nr:MerR family transcriptional regulator [Ktedonobacteraceae bacterium]